MTGTLLNKAPGAQREALRADLAHMNVKADGQTGRTDKLEVKGGFVLRLKHIQ